MSERPWKRLSITATDKTCGMHIYPLGRGRYAACGASVTWARANKDDKDEFACEEHAVASFPFTEDELITLQREMDTEIRYQSAPTDLHSGWREWVSPNKVTHIVPPAGPCATCGNGRHETSEAERPN